MLFILLYAQFYAEHSGVKRYGVEYLCVINLHAVPLHFVRYTILRCNFECYFYVHATLVTTFLQLASTTNPICVPPQSTLQTASSARIKSQASQPSNPANHHWSGRTCYPPVNPRRFTPHLGIYPAHHSAGPHQRQRQLPPKGRCFG